MCVINSMTITNRTKLNIVRGLLSLGLVVNIAYLNLLFDYDKMNTCINEMLTTITIANKWILIIHILLLARMLFFSLILTSDEIEWRYQLFQINPTNKFNMIISYRILQTVQGCIGFFNLMTFIHLYYNKDACIQDRHLIDFQSFALLPFILISIEFYLKLIIIVFVLVAMMFVPKRVFEKIDSYLYRNTIDMNDLPMTNYPRNIYCGNVPECCVCYESECNIIECGHLICDECQLKINNGECPICKSKMILIEPYTIYKHRRDKIIHNIINSIILESIHQISNKKHST